MMQEPGKCVASESQVNSVLQRMDKEVGMLAESVDRLESRMSSSVRPHEPKNKEICKEPARDMLVPIADGIDSFIRRIQDQRTKINDLVDRCEL